MKILNSFACIGGNRKLWSNEHEITAVEYREDIAKVYTDHFPQDEMIIGDAYEYILKNYRKYGFIWASTPCPSHSRARFWSSKNSDKVAPVYPDLRLYELILFLENYFDGLWVVENVIPFYEPLIKPTAKLGRHLFWANFKITNIEVQEADIKNGTREEWSQLHGFDLSNFKIESRKDQIYRNCVHPETGLHILNCALNIKTKSNTNQISIF